MFPLKSPLCSIALPKNKCTNDLLLDSTKPQDNSVFMQFIRGASIRSALAKGQNIFQALKKNLTQLSLKLAF